MDGDEQNGSAADGMLGNSEADPGGIAGADHSDIGTQILDNPSGGQPQPNSPSAPAGGPQGSQPGAGAQPNQPKQPGAPTAPQPPAVSQHLSTFDKILDAMGAKPKPTYAVDPQGNLQRQPDAPMTTRQRLGMVVAAALTGWAAGEQERGPGAGPRSIAAGASAVMHGAAADDANAKAQAVQNNQRQQQQKQQQDEQQLRQAQIFETNKRTALLARQGENAAEESRQHYISASNPVIEAARSADLNGQSALKREHLTQAALLQEHSQDGARHGTSNIYIPDGEIASVDPKTGEVVKNEDGSTKMEYTLAEIDPSAKVDLDAATLDKAVSNGFPVPGYTPGQVSTLSLPVAAAANLVHFNQGVENFRSLVGSINDKLGLKDKNALDPAAIIKSNPQVGQAFAQMAGHFDGRPSELPAALAAMQKDPKLAPYARTIVTAIGGNRIDEFAEQVKADADAKTEAAKEAAKEPFIEGRENRNAARAEARDDKKAHAHDDQLVIAGTPGSEDTQVMAKGDLPQGWLQYPLKDPQQLAATVRRTNDVQLKLNNLANFVNKGGMEHIQAGLVGDAIADLDNKIKLGAFGAELPTARINAVLDQENYNAMSEPSRQFVRAYAFAKEAMTQLPALQSFGKSNRMTETMLRSALQLLPDHRMAGNTQAAKDQMAQLQQVIDPLRKLPTGLPGAKLEPSWLELQKEGAQGGQGGGAGATKDPFSAFGGKKRETAPAAPAAQD